MTNIVSTETAGLFVGRWWAVLLRGLTAVAFGIAALAWPHVTFAVLILLFGLYALTHGIFSLVAAITSRGQGGNQGLLVLEGILGIFAGIITLRSPSTAAMVLIFCVWVWAVATGVLRIAEAIRLRRQIPGEVWLVLSGVVTVVFGLLIMLRPVLGALGLVWIIAGYALLLGVFEIMLGCELRAIGRVHTLRSA